MAIPKKGSRRIVVDGVTYRWRIRKRGPIGQVDYTSRMSMAVEREGCKGAVLELSLPHPRSTWIASGPWEVLPSHVARYIRGAIQAGWQSDVAGKHFEFDCAKSDWNKLEELNS